MIFALGREPCGSWLASDAADAVFQAGRHRGQARSHRSFHKAESIHFTSGGVVKV
jgi:hypothetical protein